MKTTKEIIELIPTEITREKDINGHLDTYYDLDKDNPIILAALNKKWYEQYEVDALNKEIKSLNTALELLKSQMEPIANTNTKLIIEPAIQRLENDRYFLTENNCAHGGKLCELEAVKRIIEFMKEEK